MRSDGGQYLSGARRWATGGERLVVSLARLRGGGSWAPLVKRDGLVVVGVEGWVGRNGEQESLCMRVACLVLVGLQSLGGCWSAWALGPLSQSAQELGRTS